MTKFSRILLFLFIIFAFSFQSANAQSNIAIENTTSNNSSGLLDGEITKLISFSELGFEDAILLQGPYQEVSTVFSLPKDWRVTGPVNIEMNVTVEFQSLMEAFTINTPEDQQSNKKGILTLEMNGIKVGELVLDQSTASTIQFLIPPDIFENNPDDIQFVVSWDSAIACQQSVSTVIAIGSDSTIEIPYTEQEVTPQLNDFPKPFYSKTIVDPSPLVLIIPENPDEDELSALVAISAGLGKQTNGKASYDLFLFNEITQRDLESHNLIVIGKIASLDKIFNGKPSQGFADISTNSEDDENGIISVITSPWNPSRVVMVVTGSNAVGLQKASAAVSAKDFLTNSDGNTAKVTEISDPLSKVQFQIDQEIGGLLAEETLYIGHLGKSTIVIPFSVPGGIQINPEAYIEVYFRHSQLINYLQSSITVSLNDEVIGTIRFSDQSSSNGLARILLPPNSVRPLKNTLELTFTIVPQDICADDRSGNYWISIFQDSYLHLPPTLDATTAEKKYYLGGLINAFLDENSLSNLVLIAAQNDLTSWKYASKMAYSLGSFSTANIMLPAAAFPETYFSDPIKKNIILIGESKDIPFTSGINEMLPLPIRTDGSLELLPNDGVVFEFDSNQTFGVLEIISGAGNKNEILVILGNTPQGLSAAFKKAQDWLHNPQVAVKNVEVIDQEEISHTYFMETKSSLNGEDGSSQAGWVEKLFEFSSNLTALILLFISLAVTLAFSAWAFRGGSKK